jgi:hypothetical protein
MKQTVTALYRASKTGAAFAARLAEQGYTLLKGAEGPCPDVDDPVHCGAF